MTERPQNDRINKINPTAVRVILGIPEDEPAGNSAAFMGRWQRMVLNREYGELTIKLTAGQETAWEERITHKI